MNVLIVLLALTQSSWDLEALSTPPKQVAAEGFEAEGLKAVYYEGLPWKGKPTRVFAWVGLPKTDGAKVPAMVLIHGGGGTAFSDWAKLWTGRGYAAIAMDLCGAVPRKVTGQRGVPTRNLGGEQQTKRWNHRENSIDAL